MKLWNTISCTCSSHFSIGKSFHPRDLYMRHGAIHRLCILFIYLKWPSKFGLVAQLQNFVTVQDYGWFKTESQACSKRLPSESRSMVSAKCGWKKLFYTQCRQTTACIKQHIHNTVHHYIIIWIAPPPLHHLHQPIIINHFATIYAACIYQFVTPSHLFPI